MHLISRMAKGGGGRGLFASPWLLVPPLCIRRKKVMLRPPRGCGFDKHDIGFLCFFVSPFLSNAYFRFSYKPRVSPPPKTLQILPKGFAKVGFDAGKIAALAPKDRPKVILETKRRGESTRMLTLCNQTCANTLPYRFYFLFSSALVNPARYFNSLLKTTSYLTIYKVVIVFPPLPPKSKIIYCLGSLLI